MQPTFTQKSAAVHELVAHGFTHKAGAWKHPQMVDAELVREQRGKWTIVINTPSYKIRQQVRELWRAYDEAKASANLTKASYIQHSFTRLQNILEVAEAQDAAQMAAHQDAMMRELREG